jgi:ABC-type nitrate/sulfonate/bicarbonate transport system permease component
VSDLPGGETVLDHPVAGRPRGAGLRPTVAALAPAIALLLALGAAWEVWVRVADVPRYLLPPPSAIWAAFLHLRPTLPGHVAATLTAATAGLLLAALIGALLAVLITGVALVRRVLYPLLVVSQTIPMIVLAPLLIAWFGFGLGPKVAVVALIGVFPIVVSTVDGIDRADRDVIEVVRSMGASRLDLARHVLVPSALPAFFAGLTIAAAYAMVGAVIAEWMGASAGLGLLLTRSQASFRVDQVFVGIALIALVSVALFGTVRMLGRLATPWNHPTKELR